MLMCVLCFNKRANVKVSLEERVGWLAASLLVIVNANVPSEMHCSFE